jgi:hypothetical protein
VEALLLGAVVFRAGLLPERLQDGRHGGGALRGQVAADHARAAERGTDLEIPVGEADRDGWQSLVEPLIQGEGGMRRRAR